MFRLKDFISLPNIQNDSLNVCIYNNDGTEIDYKNNDTYINLLVDRIRFVKESNIGKIEYRCNITLSDKIGESSIVRKFIKFNEVYRCCKEDKVIIIPVDSNYNSAMWDGKISLMEHYESEAVINIIPMFGKDHSVLKVILSDNVQIVNMSIAQ